MSDRPEYPSYPDGGPEGQGPGDGQPSSTPPGPAAAGWGQPQQAQPPYDQPHQGQPPYGQAPYGQAPYGQPGPYGPGYGYAPPRPAAPTSGKAVAALVLGIFSIVLCYLGVLVGPAAIVLGVMAKRDVKARPGALGGESMATAGLVTGIIGTAVWGVVIVLMIIGLTVA